MNRFSGCLLGLCAVFLLATAHAQPLRPMQAPPDDAPPGVRLAYWFQQAGQAYEADRVDDWVAATEQLHELRPYNQDFMTHLVRGYARQENLSKAFEMMLHMQQQGLAQDWSAFDELEPLRPHRLYGHLTELMTEAGQPFGEFEVHATLPDDLAMPEAIAYDAEAGRVFVGSIRDGSIRYSRDGEDWTLFAESDSVDGLHAVFDLVVDQERGHLWAATAMVGHFEGFDEAMAGQTGVLKFDLESGERLAAMSVPASGMQHLLGSLALAADGTLFAADTNNPVLFRLPPGGEALELFFGNQNFSSLRGLALSADDRLLYMSDYEQGIFVLATDGSNQGWKLAVPENLNEGGIDGLYWWDDHLIAIQNGISPQRVLRLQLGPDGLGVTGIAPVLAALETFDTPTFGAMEGSRLLLFSGSHWGHVDGRGHPRGDELPAVEILATDVDAATLMSVGEEAMRQMQGGR